MLVASVDVGYSNVKIATQHKDGREPMAWQVSPAGAGALGKLTASLNGARSLGSGVHVVLDGEDYVALVDPRNLQLHERPLHEDYPRSMEYRALFLGALEKIGAQRIGRLVTGLPVIQAQNKALRQRLETQLSGTHTIRPGVTVTVDAVSVLPQPVGAWLSFLHANPRYRRADMRAMVFDVGFYSVDYVVLDNGKLSDVSSGSSLLATSKILEKAAELILEQNGIRVSVARIESAVRAKHENIQVGTREVPLAPILKVAAKAYAPDVVNQVKRSLRADAEGIGLILLAGGGAELYRDALRAAMPATTEIVGVENPVTANATGFCYFGMSL